ncbi:hypothetical protein FALBO_17459, partial [Fusarium albosuccineum]
PAPAPAPVETKTDDNPWSKSKGQSSLAFDGLEKVTEIPKGSKQGKEDLWGFGAKEEKKKTNLWGAEPEEEVKDGDPWGWGGSKKKGKGSLLEEIPEPAPGADKKDIWDTWGISKKDRAKKKNIIDDGASSHLEPAPDPPQADDLWGGWSSKKDKPKKSSIWGEQELVPEPAPDPPSFEDRNDGDDFWSTFGGGKPKGVEEAPPAEGWSSWGMAKQEPIKPADDSWDLWGTGKKKKKAGDLIQLGDEIPPAVPDPIEAVGGDDFLDSWGFGKKTKKVTDPFAFKTAGPEEPSDDFWGSLGKKPNAHEFLVEPTGEISQHDDVVEVMGSKAINDEDDDWGWTSSSKTKKSQHRMDTLTNLLPPAPAPPSME